MACVDAVVYSWSIRGNNRYRLSAVLPQRTALGEWRRASAAQCLGAPRVSSRDRFEMSGGNSLEPGLKKYRELQAQIAKLQSGAGQANTQIMENEMVLKELDLLEEDAQVFKLIGPVLVKQELVEVKTNVSKRIEFIKNDIGRLESSVKAKEKEQEEVRSQIAKLQKQQAEATGGQ